jgi:pseudaminic acid synthase
LLTIPDIIERFGVKSGLSDHTLGTEAPVVAVALGAKVIEKHFILDKSIGGADAHFSLDVEEFTQMVNAVRLTEKMMGKVDYEMTEKKKNSREFSRSLFITKDVESGEILSANNVRSVRPGFGLHPKYYHEVLGKTFSADYKKGTPLSLEHFRA